MKVRIDCGSTIRELELPELPQAGDWVLLYGYPTPDTMNWVKVTHRRFVDTEAGRNSPVSGVICAVDGISGVLPTRMPRPARSETSDDP